MAPLGLTYGYLGVGTNTYHLKDEFTPPAVLPWEVVAECPDSVVVPIENMGYVRPVIAGKLQVLGSAVDATVTDILSPAAERKISFMQCGEERYIKAKGGSVTAWGPKAAGHSLSTDYFYVWFSFSGSRTAVYLASDDSILWGG